jgi:Pyridine nucleotide-disulphide oxidoreductase
MGFTAPRGQDRLFSTQIGRTSRSPRAAQAPAEVQSRAEDGLPIPEIPHSIGLCTPYRKYPIRSGYAPGRRPPKIEESPGTVRTLPADLVLLAMGFLGPEREGMLAELGLDIDGRGNVAVDEDQQTSVPGVFAAGDMARGQSLVVWAIMEGRQAARGVDRALMGETVLL